MIVLADVYGLCLEGCYSAFLLISSSPGANQHHSLEVIILCFNCPVCNTCTYPLAPYFWVFAFILSGWTVLYPLRKPAFISLLSADILAVGNGVK